MIMKLTNQQCDEVISWISYFGKSNVRYCPDVCSPAGLHKSRLDYNICEVKREETTQWFFDLISEFLKDEYPNNKINEGNYFYAHEFFTGGKFTKHVDRERQNDWAIIIGAKLNDDFEGGEFWLDDKLLEGNTRGMAYYYDSTQWHEVKPIKSGTRYSMLCYVRARDFVNKQTKSLL